MRNAALLLLPFLLWGCTDHALFVTETSAGVNFDSKPPTASIGIDRVEGWIGPREAAGGVPPAIAAIQSDGKIFGASVRQLYATGAAAETVSAKPGKSGGTDPALSGDRSMMFFGTSTSIGLKVGFTGDAPVPDSFVFGYKRKEMSYIPLGKDTSNNDVYPAVLASIDTTADASVSSAGSPSAELTDRQFFATGTVANNLAARDEIRSQFDARESEALKAYQQQAQATVKLFSCYPRVSTADLPIVWEDGAHQLLYGAAAPVAGSSKSLTDREQDEAGTIYTLLKVNLTAGAVSNAAAQHTGSQTYLDTIAGVQDADPDRVTRLYQHADLVCALSRRNS